MLKKDKGPQKQQIQYVRRDSSFNLRDLVMRTPTSSSPDRSPDVYGECTEKETVKENVKPVPSPAVLLEKGKEQIEHIINELRSFDVNTIQRRSDPRIKALTGRINEVLADIFGRNSEEYDNHAIYSLDTLPITIGGSWYPLPEVREGYQKGIESAISKLSSLLRVQRGKLEALQGNKPQGLEEREKKGQRGTAVNGKVSLVNLRGKIKSRETVLFSQPKAVDGSGSARAVFTPELILPEAQPKESSAVIGSVAPDQQERECGRGKRISNLQFEPPSHEKTMVLLENLEEKLKKLEEDIPGVEEHEEEKTYKEKEGGEKDGVSHQEGDLATLVAQLNEIVATEPEYAEAHVARTALRSEEQLARGEVKEAVVVGEEPPILSSGDGASVQSSPKERDEIFVIDGDTMLSSESTIIELLESENGQAQVLDGSEGLLQTPGDEPEARTIISLEDLERKLRELEEKEAEEGEARLTGDEGEGVLLIEGTHELPDELTLDIHGDSDSKEVIDEKVLAEEVLVINGDEQFNRESVGFEAATEDSHNEELLLIECDEGLPEDVSHELPEDEQTSQTLCAHEVYRGTTGYLRTGHDLIHTDSDLIIKLFSRATPFYNEFYHDDEFGEKAVILEDLEGRLRVFRGPGVDGEYFGPWDFTALEKGGYLPCFIEAKGDDRLSSSVEKDYVTEASVVETIIVQLAKTHPKDAPSASQPAEMVAGGAGGNDGTRETLPGPAGAEPVERADEENILQLSEDTVYGETLSVAAEGALDDIVWYELCAREDGHEEAIIPTVNGVKEELAEQGLSAQRAWEEFPSAIVGKDNEDLSDHTCEAPVGLPFNMGGLPPMVEEKHHSGLRFDEEKPFFFTEDLVFDGEDYKSAGLYMGGEETPEETIFMVSEEPKNTVTGETSEEWEIIARELPWETTSDSGSILRDEMLATLDGEEGVQVAPVMGLLDGKVLLPTEADLNNMEWCRSEGSFGVGEAVDEIQGQHTMTVDSLVDLPDELPFNEIGTVELDTVIVGSSLEDDNPEKGDVSSGLVELDDNLTLFDSRRVSQDAVQELAAEEGPLGVLEGAGFEHEPLSPEAFERCSTGFESEKIEDIASAEPSRDSILLEALEEMLSNLEASTSTVGDSGPHFTHSQVMNPPEEEKVLATDSRKETPKAVLIKNHEERCNPFAVTEITKERSPAKTLCAEDLQAQIGELRYRVDDLQTFDVESIDQRFDPRVRALGDTVNNTLADIFGRNTPAYWQHALPSLDSLPVVVGGPKLSPEELRDAYRRRINEAISKVTITIDILEAKLGSLEGKSEGKKAQAHFTHSQVMNPPEEEKVLATDSRKETPKAVLIKNHEERCNPFAVTEITKERSPAKTLCAEDLQAQIGELRYRVDDLQTFDVESIDQRFDPRVRALGDTVNNTLADIFGRNTPAYWQHALPSLDSLPVVVGGPKLSPEELRDAYRRRINEAISKVTITIDILEAKLGRLEGKSGTGQVLYFAPKPSQYSDIQSLR